MLPNTFGGNFQYIWHCRNVIMPALVALMVASRYALPGYGDHTDLGSELSLTGSLVSGL